MYIVFYLYYYQYQCNAYVYHSFSALLCSGLPLITDSFLHLKRLPERYKSIKGLLLLLLLLPLLLLLLRVVVSCEVKLFSAEVMPDAMICKICSSTDKPTCRPAITKPSSGHSPLSWKSVIAGIILNMVEVQNAIFIIDAHYGYHKSSKNKNIQNTECMATIRVSIMLRFLLVGFHSQAWHRLDFYLSKVFLSWWKCHFIVIGKLWVL